MKSVLWILRPARLALLAGLLGATILFFAFQSGSSPRSIVVDANGRTSLCEGNHLFFQPGGLDGAPPKTAPVNPDGTIGCPAGERRALAEVTLEWPSWTLNFGFALIVGSIVWQIALARDP